MSSGEIQGAALAKIVSTENYKKVAIVASENGYSKAVVDGILNKINPLSTTFYPPTQKEEGRILDYGDLVNVEMSGEGFGR